MANCSSRKDWVSLLVTSRPVFLAVVVGRPGMGRSRWGFVMNSSYIWTASSWYCWDVEEFSEGYELEDVLSMSRCHVCETSSTLKSSVNMRILPQLSKWGGTRMWSLSAVLCFNVCFCSMLWMPSDECTSRCKAAELSGRWGTV